ncbi:MobV family relaxase [Niallia sp. Krafla_26]|uniref:MobV family relaxase n=1 Tax=Niallia sp. Krafla_26 TaxID=3064703 RepID=UPI003D16F0D2
MSEIICFMRKMKSHDLKDNQFLKLRESQIDWKQNQFMYDLVNDGRIDYYRRAQEIIESQKNDARKIRKDAVLVNELLITSDQNFFDQLPSNDQKRFFEESYSWFSMRYGSQNIAYAIVISDEKKSYIRIGVVPMRNGKLQGKHVFNQTELRWIQSEFLRYLQKQGFELQKGVKKSTRDDVTTLGRKVKTLNDEIGELKHTLYEKQLEKQSMEQSIKDIDLRLVHLRKSLDDVRKMETLEKAVDELKIENEHLKKENKKLQGNRDKGTGPVSH